MRPAFFGVLLVSLTATSVAATTTERWTATSRTATSITGDIELSPSKLVAAGKTFPLAVAADVAAFETSGGPKSARIMRVTREVNPVLLRGNTLCSPAARWIALYRSDAGLCATYYYTR